MQSLWPPTTTSTFPLSSRDCCFCLPLGFRRVPPCAVSLASMPLSVSAWSLTGRVWWDLSTRQTPPLPTHRTPQLRGRLLPSSHASSSFFTGIFPVGRTRSRTVSDGQPYFFSSLFFRGSFVFLFLCARTEQNPPETELSNKLKSHVQKNSCMKPVC